MRPKRPCAASCGRALSEAGGEDAVERHRRAAALQVAEDGDPDLVLDAGRELGRQALAGAAQARMAVAGVGDLDRRRSPPTGRAPSATTTIE